MSDHQIAEIRLAIVIPFAKTAFFKASLESIANQTDKRFNLYIGADIFVDNLENEIGLFFNKQKLIKYFRFSEKSVSKKLISQWERCIQLTNQEPWIWLFSDDDLMSENCVASFYEILEATEGMYDLYRFNKIEIDAEGKPLNVPPPHPTYESSIEFCYHLLKGERKCTAVEYIFSRKTFDKHGGFVSFPYAWGSDWCTWFLFGQEKGIRLIPNGTVFFRHSHLNISSDLKLSDGKILASLEYSRWINNFFSTTTHPTKPIDGNSIKLLTELHLFSSFQNFTTFSIIKAAHKVAKTTNQVWGKPYKFYMLKIIYLIISKIIKTLIGCLRRYFI